MIPAARRLVVATAFLCLAMGATMELFASGDEAVVSPIASVTVSQTVVPRRAQIRPIETFSEIASHPLFNRGRALEPQMPVVAPAPPAPAEPAPPIASLSATLVGIVMSPHFSAAIVRAADGKTKAIAEGEEIDGWTLTGISQDRASFASGEAEVNLGFVPHQASPVAATQSAPPIPLTRRR